MQCIGDLADEFEMGYRTLLLTAVTRIANGEKYSTIS